MIKWVSNKMSVESMDDIFIVVNIFVMAMIPIWLILHNMCDMVLFDLRLLHGL
jgi:hypothetical protein